MRSLPSFSASTVTDHCPAGGLALDALTASLCCSLELHGLGERVEEVRPAGVVSQGVQPLALAHRGAVVGVTEHCLFLRIL